MKKVISMIIVLCAATTARAQIVPLNGYLLVADNGANAVHIYNTTTGTYVGDMVPPPSGFTPISVVTGGPQGQIYVADTKGNIWTYAGPYSPPNPTPLATILAPYGMAIAQAPVYSGPVLGAYLYAVTLSPFGTIALSTQIYTINENNGSFPSPYSQYLTPPPSGAAFFPSLSAAADAASALYVETFNSMQVFAINGAPSAIIPAPFSVAFTAPGSSNQLFSGQTGATFDANGHLFVSGLTSGTAVPAIFEDQNLVGATTPNWRTLVSNLPSTSPLAFDAAGNLYAAYVANGSTTYPLQKINPSTGAATNVGPVGVIKNPVSMAWFQSFIARKYPIFGGGVFGFVGIPSGASLNLAVTAVPTVAAGSSETCPVTLQFTDTSGNVIASNIVGLNHGEAAALDYTNMTGALQQARAELLINSGAPLEACGSALSSLTLTNGTTIVTIPPTVMGIPLFPPIGLPAGDNLMLSLTNDAASLEPPDPCIVNISFVDASGNVLQTKSATVAPGQTTSVFYSSIPPPSTSSSMTLVRPVFAMISSGLTCSALVPSLTVVDSTGTPRAAFPGAQAPCGNLCAVPVP